MWNKYKIYWEVTRMGKERIDDAFKEKMTAKQNIFVPYIMAGDGGLGHLDEQIDFLQKCGVAAIELGIPFSDPVADGPTIQRAGIRALKNGVTLSNVLQTLKHSKKDRTIPIILMTYINPIFSYGVEEFARDCQASGVDGVSIPDVPLEEESLVTSLLKKYSIDFIRLSALTSLLERLDEFAKRYDGFLITFVVQDDTGI